MLVYGYKGKKCPKSTDFNYCEKKLWALIYYNIELFNDSKVNREIWLRQVYNTFNTLCKFNNYLLNAYEVDDKFYNDIDFLKQYLIDNEDVVDSVNRKCREIYSNLNIWYKRLVSNPKCLDEIKWQVVKSMKFYEKQEIFSITSTNLKRNYYDFVV